MPTLIGPLQKIGHRVMDYVLARLAFAVTAFHPLIQRHGLNPDPDGFIPLSIADFNP